MNHIWYGHHSLQSAEVVRPTRRTSAARRSLRHDSVIRDLVVATLHPTLGGGSTTLSSSPLGRGKPKPHDLVIKAVE